MTTSTHNPAICPSCGKSNQCAQASSDTPVGHCWCFDLIIDPQHLPERTGDLTQQSCLCPACARGQKAAESGS